MGNETTTPDSAETMGFDGTVRTESKTASEFKQTGVGGRPMTYLQTRREQAPGKHYDHLRETV